MLFVGERGEVGDVDVGLRSAGLDLPTRNKTVSAEVGSCAGSAGQRTVTQSSPVSSSYVVGTRNQRDRSPYEATAQVPGQAAG